MKIVKLVTGLLSVNTYLLINEDTNECVIIDSAENYDAVKSKITELGVKAKYLLYTHAHFDHIGNAHLLQKDGLKAYISEVDAKKLDTDEHLGFMYRHRFTSFTPDAVFSDGDVLNLCDINIRVVLTPGHTTGSVCFIVDDNLFTGDTLFKDTVGRTDFPSGDVEALRKSVKKLYALKGDYKVFSGHGEDTTLSRERIYNMFIRQDD